VEGGGGIRCVEPLLVHGSITGPEGCYGLGCEGVFERIWLEKVRINVILSRSYLTPG